jgi:hypothetical protein
VSAWVKRQRGGIPSITSTMMGVLRHLRQAKRDEYAYQTLSDVHGRTINALLERDWIAESPGYDGTRYYLTGRGEKALKVYERPTRHFDGLCSQCEERPRGHWSNGNLKPYCDECQRTLNNRRYHDMGNRYREGQTCPRCGERERHTYPSGFTIGYCLECRTAMRKEERERKHARRIEMARRGEPMMCIACEKAPIYITGKTTYDYCHACYQKQQRKYRNRKAWESAMGTRERAAETAS